MRCKRSGIFLGQVLERKDTLVQCTLASLVPSDSSITLSKKSMFIQPNGIIYLEIQVRGNKFILGDQIVGLQ